MDNETLDNLNDIFSKENLKSLFIAGLKQLIADQQETLDTNRIEMVNLRFDLEATRRERDTAMSKVKELEAGEDE